MSIDMTLQKRAIFIMGVYGEISHFLLDPTEIGFWPYKKRRLTPWKFKLEITSNKKSYAKKPLTNLYEMNSRGNVGKMDTLSSSHVLSVS